MPSRTCGGDRRSGEDQARHIRARDPGQAAERLDRPADASTKPTVAARPPPRPCRWRHHAAEMVGHPAQDCPYDRTTVARSAGSRARARCHSHRLGDDDTEDDETEHVVDDGRTEDGHRGPGVHELELLEGCGRDPDARRGQDRPDEDAADTGPSPKSSATALPATNGTRTPPLAARKAPRPTDRIAATLVSSPATARIAKAPSSAMPSTGPCRRPRWM